MVARALRGRGIGRRRALGAEHPRQVGEDLVCDGLGDHAGQRVDGAAVPPPTPPAPVSADDRSAAGGPPEDDAALLDGCRHALRGQDSLLSIVQMPAGIPVATMAVGGARNAGLMAVRILAAGEGEEAARLRGALGRFAADLGAQAHAKGERLRQRVAGA